MEYRISIIILILGIFIFGIAGACASDVNDTLLASEDTDVTEISQIDEISADDDSQLMGQCSEKTIREGNAGTFQELQDSINSTESGKTLTLEKNYGDDDNFGGEGIIIDKSITIEGNGHVIDGAKQGRIFFINAAEKIVLNNITFKNGYAKSGAAGGAIVFNNTNDVVVSNCIFENCKAYDAGAILFNNSGNCSVSGCAFLNNSAEFHGGAIASEMTGIYVFDSTFDGNNALAGGGTIFMKEFSAGNSVIDGCLIYNSYVGASNDKEGGGAILIAKDETSKITVSNSAITNSTTAEGPGGAISVLAWNCSLINLTVRNSSAQNDDGGAIYWKGSNGYLVNISIFNASANSAGSGKSSNGGAIFYDGTKGTLINASISNTFAAGNGGAIYWKGSSPVAINNVSITHSRTEVTGPTNSADGGAIYSTTITQFDNVYISDAHSRKNQGDVYGGAIYCKDGQTFNNITVIASGASTDNGTSYGGAVYSQRQFGSTSVSVYNSTFEQNNADMGGGLYFEKLAGKIYGSSFAGNVADSDGGAVYANKEGMEARSSVFEYNSAKNGGAIFAQNAQVVIRDSTLEFNAAEEKGGALYYNYIDKATSSQIIGTDLVNNTAFQGSAIYGTKFNKFSLIDSVLLDNRANSSGFIEKTAGVDGEGHTYVSGVFVGFDNLANAIWQEATVTLACSNVTYWGVGGKKTANSPPDQSDREANINVTVEIYDENGVKLSTANVVTDKNGEFKHTFDGEDGKTYHFAFVHDGDGYYADLRDTLSNGSHVKIYANASVYYSQNQTFLIELTDGAWENMNGTVSVTFNDSEHTTFTVDVINGIGVKSNCTYLPAGHYNATASFAGDTNHTGDSDWVLFEVLPYYDLHITKAVNVTTDTANVKDIINYTITVTNHGPGKAYGVNVTEILSLSLKLIESNLTAGNYNSSEGYWYIGELDVGHFETLTIIAEIIHMGEIDNTVWVTGLGKDADEANNVDSAHNFTAMAVVDLSVNKTCDKDEYCIGDIAVWTITVCNAGNGTDAANVTLYDYFPGDYFEIINITVDSGTYAEQIKNSYYLWDIGFMANGTNASMVITSRALQEREDILNFASIFSSEDEWDYDNNVARKTADVIKPYSTVNVTGVVLNYGESTNITVTAEGAIGITAKINDNPVGVINNYIIPISGLDVGTYTLTVTAIPDSNHYEVTGTANITVNKANPEIKVNVSLDGGNAIIDVTAPDDISEIVLVDVDGKGYYVNLTDGKGQLVVSGLAGGLHNVTVKYPGDDRYNPSESQSESFEVCNISSVVSVKADNIAYGDKAIIEVTVPVDATGNVMVIIDGKPYTENVSSSKAIFIVAGLGIGNYTVDVTYNGDKKYASNSNSTKLEVSPVKTDETDIFVIDQGNGTVVVVVSKNATGIITVKVGEHTFNSTIVDGRAVINIDNETPGTHDVDVIYWGDGNHGGNSVVSNITVPKYDSPIFIDVQCIEYGKTVVITVNVLENATGNVSIEIDGVRYIKEIHDGVVEFTLKNLTAGTKTIYVEYTGDDNYVANHTTVNVTVSKVNPEIKMNVTLKGDTAVIDVTAPDDVTNPVLIEVDGNGYYANINEGKGQLIIPGLAGRWHNVTAKYPGDGRYSQSEPIFKSFEVCNVSSAVSVKADNITYGDNAVIEVTLPADAGGNVTVTIDGKPYTENVSSSKAILIVAGLGAGNYTVNVTYNGDAKYASGSNFINLEVSKAKTFIKVIDIGNGTVIVFVGDNVCSNVTVKAGNNNYDAVAEDGVAMIDLGNETCGDHDIEVICSGDENHTAEYANASITVNKFKTLIIANAVTATYNVKKDLIISLKDVNGNPVSGAKITVDLNGAKTYTTDENGNVKVSLKGLAPNTYTAKITFNGNDNYEKSAESVKVTVKKATPKITAKKKTFKAKTKSKKYTITLKDNTGKAIKKAKVTLKVKGKTYKTKTNSKGKATFKIKKLKKKGKYKAVITYKGNKYYKKVTKKVKLTVKASKKKKSTFKTLSKGSKDKSTVKKIQKALKNNGYYLTYNGRYLKIDGIYHGYTEKSVKEFQHDKGLKVSGKVDEKTAKKLGII